MAGAQPAVPTETSGRYIVVLNEQVSDPTDTAIAQGREFGFSPRQVYSAALPGYTATLSKATAQELASDPAVAFVTADQVFAKAPPPPLAQSCRVAPADVQCLDDSLDRVDAERSSTRSGDGRGSVPGNVAVVDSGVDASHPDLNVAGGVDCSTGTAVTARPPTDDAGHGTFVAGVLGARDNGIGIVGVAPGIRVWSARVDDAAGEITTSAVLCAIDWVTSTRLDRSRGNDVTVANMSLENEGADDGDCGRTNHDPVHLAICVSTGVGVTWVAAAGNDTADVQGFIPAGYDEVLTATAIADYDGKPGGRAAPDCYGLDWTSEGLDDSPASFSNFATTIRDRLHTVAAPAVCVVSTFPPHFGYDYAIWSGTSFASPVVAGTVALCQATGPCRGEPPAVVRARIVADGARYNLTHPSYGYAGDPLRPAGMHYGFLVRAGLY
jgi:subtilisin family serine protease